MPGGSDEIPDRYNHTPRLNLSSSLRTKLGQALLSFALGCLMPVAAWVTWDSFQYNGAIRWLKNALKTN